jgi:hypothetical protein
MGKLISKIISVSLPQDHPFRLPGISKLNLIMVPSS